MSRSSGHESEGIGWHNFPRDDARQQEKEASLNGEFKPDYIRIESSQIEHAVPENIEAMLGFAAVAAETVEILASQARQAIRRGNDASAYDALDNIGSRAATLRTQISGFESKDKKG